VDVDAMRPRLGSGGNVASTVGTRKPSGGSKAARRLEQARRRRRNTYLGAAVAALIVIGLAVILLTPKTPTGTVLSPPGSVTISRATGPQLAPGESVPDFTAPRLEGGTVRWSDYAGHPTVLAIWAPWCPHCQRELPILAQAAADYPSVKVVTVATAIGQEPGPSVESYLQSHNLSFTVGIDDTNTSILKGMGVSSFPTVYYVGADGKVVRATVGELPLSQMESYFSQISSS
jgi:thiol-disulfide isomerase/thioredoxin